MVVRELAACVVADCGRDEERGVTCFMDDFPMLPRLKFALQMHNLLDSKNKRKEY